MPSWGDALKQKLPLALATLAAGRSGGQQAIAALLRGRAEAQAAQAQAAQAQAAAARQRLLDASRLETEAVGRVATESQMARQEEAAYLSRLGQAREQAGGALDIAATTAPDLNAALVSGAQQTSALEGQYGLAPGTLASSLAGMSVRRQRVIRQEAESLLEKMAKLGGDQAQATVRLSPTAQPQLFRAAAERGWGPTLTPQQLQEAAELPVMMASPSVSGTGASDLDRSFQREKAAREEELGRPLTRAEAVALDRQVRREIADAGRSSATQATSTGYPVNVDRRINQLSDRFGQEPTVRRMATIAEGYQFAQRLPNDTRNPADDQALIYAFAKAMDPESVVREGEYATVQRYAQSWVESFGFNAMRVVQNREFLTPEARRNIKATIADKYAVSRSSYDNLRRETVKQIERATGTANGDQFLIEYAGAFPEVSSPRRPADQASTQPTEGDVKPIPGYPGTEQTYRQGRWIRTK